VNFLIWKGAVYVVILKVLGVVYMGIGMVSDCVLASVRVDFVLVIDVVIQAGVGYGYGSGVSL
jgi:hypothetical protein